MSELVRLNWFVISAFQLDRKLVFFSKLELEVLLTNTLIPKKLLSRAHQGKFWEGSIRISIMGTTYWFVSPYCCQHNASTALVLLYTTIDSFFLDGFTCYKIHTAKLEKNLRFAEYCVRLLGNCLFINVLRSPEKISLLKCSTSNGLLLIFS